MSGMGGSRRSGHKPLCSPSFLGHRPIQTAGQNRLTLRPRVDTGGYPGPPGADEEPRLPAVGCPSATPGPTCLRRALWRQVSQCSCFYQDGTATHRGRLSLRREGYSQFSGGRARRGPAAGPPRGKPAGAVQRERGVGRSRACGFREDGRRGGRAGVGLAGVNSFRGRGAGLSLVAWDLPW